MASRAVSARASSRLRLVPVPAAGSRRRRSENVPAAHRPHAAGSDGPAPRRRPDHGLLRQLGGRVRAVRVGFLFFQRQAVYAGVGVLGLLPAVPDAVRDLEPARSPVPRRDGVLLVLVLHSGPAPAPAGHRDGSPRAHHHQPLRDREGSPRRFAVTVLSRKAALLDDVGHLLLPLLPVTRSCAGS